MYIVQYILKYFFKLKVLLLLLFGAVDLNCHEKNGKMESGDVDSKFGTYMGKNAQLLFQQNVQ